MPAPSTRLVFAIAAALYLSLCAATGMWWEWEHDEGVSFSQAFGTPLVGWRDEGSRIAVAYLRVDGATPRTASGVMDALTVGGGMHPPAYYLFLRQWGGWFGTNRLLLRLPIYLLGAVSLLAVGALARRLVGGKAEPWAMLLLAASPWFVGFSNLARPYALALCLALLSSNALLLALETRRLVWRLAFAFVSAFGLYTIYPYVYVLGWQLATWFVFAAGWGGETSPGQLEPAPGERRASRELAALAGIVLLIALLYAPWLPRLLGHLDVTAGQDW